MFIIMVPAQSCHIWAPKGRHRHREKCLCCSCASQLQEKREQLLLPALLVGTCTISISARCRRTAEGKKYRSLSGHFSLTAELSDRDNNTSLALFLPCSHLHQLPKFSGIKHSEDAQKQPCLWAVSFLGTIQRLDILVSRWVTLPTVLAHKSLRLTEILKDSLTSLRSNFTAAFLPKLSLGDDITSGFCTTFSS